VRSPGAAPAAGLTREALAGARILVEKISRTSISLARLLSRMGARVRLVDPSPRVAPEPDDPQLAHERHGTVESYLAEAIPADQWEECRSLQAEGVSVEIGWNWQADAFEFDILFVDLYPPPTRPFIQQVRRRGKQVSIASDLVLRLRPLPAVGVTGSAGKSTTTALIDSMLRAAGQSTYVGRDNVAQNPWINYEVLDQLEHMQPPGWIVAELTSSHLEYMHSSPAVAVVTNLWPDHVEWHGSLPAYYEAKATIVKHQSAEHWAILNCDDLTRSVLGPHCQGRVAYFSLTQPVAHGVYLSGEDIVARWHDRQYMIARPQDVHIGPAYLGNVLAASGAALAMNVPPEAIREALRSFRGLARRFEMVGRVGDVPIVNDSMANTPQKACASLDAFGEASLVLIAGGHRRTSWSDCLHNSAEAEAQVEAACRRAAAKARAVVLFGEAAPVLHQCLLSSGMAGDRIDRVASLEQALEAALGRAAAGDTVLLAPIFYVHPHESAAFDALVFEAAQRDGGPPPSA
jgi:UDP-N-acetylmuramoylalanine--D-glutamate ligase